MGTPAEVIATLKHDGDGAEKLKVMLREGLNDEVHLGEVRSDASDLAHDLLGCHWWVTLLYFVDGIEEMPEELDSVHRQCGWVIVNEALTHLAEAILMMGRPLGTPECTQE